MHQLAQVICITETWLTSNINDQQTDLDGYDQHRNDRQKGSKSRGGGISVYINKKWSKVNRIIHSLSQSDIEILSVISRPMWLPREFSSVITVACYAPCTGGDSTKSATDKTARTIAQHITDIQLKYPNSAIMIMGDFNKVKISIPNFQQIVNKPTRGTKLLDLCFVNVKESYKYCKQLPSLGNSDHNIIHLIPKYIPKAKFPAETTTRRKFNDHTISDLQACFEITDWDEIIHPGDGIDTQAEVLTDYLNFCIDEHVPKISLRKYSNNKPWISRAIIQLVKDKHKAHKEGNKKLRNYLKNKIKHEMLKARRNYTAKIQHKLALEPAKAWSEIRKLCGISKEKHSDIAINSDTLNKFFARFEEKCHSNCMIEIPAQGSQAPALEIEQEEVVNLLKQVDSRKGAGPDKIMPKVLKLCADQLASALTMVFNSSLKQGQVPQIWKTSTIKPIPKSSNPQEPKDYRPIAITSCIGKLLEKLVKKYILEHTPLDSLQFAYRPGRSTQDALAYLMTTITTHIEKDSKNIARCLFLDYSSAFNTISVEKLVKRLDHLDRNIVNWIFSFLTNRLQYTYANDSLSGKISTSTGTPQGAVLSPVLFAIYTSIITSESSNVTVIKYADDTVIVGLLSQTEDTNCYMNEIKRICKLSSEHSLILNPQKTKEMLFTTKRVPPAVEPVCVAGTAISISGAVKYLGVIIDEKLSFSEHCSRIIAKANQRLYIINRFRYLGAKPSFLKVLFSGFVESIILYCLPVFYNSLSASNKKELSKFHKRAVKYNMSPHSLDFIANQRLRITALKAFLDENHFIHQFLVRLPSGRIQTFKHRTLIGKSSFIRHIILFLNDTLF